MNVLDVRNVLNVTGSTQGMKSSTPEMTSYSTGITVDDELSPTSKNPVQNKVVYAALQEKQDLLPSGNTGDFLQKTADGVQWSPVSGALPTQTGQSGKFLTTDGTDASWATVNALPSQTGNSGKFLTTNGTTASWATVATSTTQTWFSDQTGNTLDISSLSGTVYKVFKNGLLLKPSSTPIVTETITWAQGGDYNKYVDLLGPNSETTFGNDTANTWSYETIYETPSNEPWNAYPSFFAATQMSLDGLQPTLLLNPSNNIYALARYVGSSSGWDIEITSDDALQANKQYNLKWSFDGTYYALRYKLVDSSVWSEKKVAGSFATVMQNYPRCLNNAVNGTYYANGKMCLTKTKIVKNGVTMWDGSDLNNSNYTNTGCTITTEVITTADGDYYVNGHTIEFVNALSGDTLMVETK